MEKSIGLGVFGTLGNPNGYQQSFFLNAQFPQNLDLNPNAVEVFPGSELFVVRKDATQGVYSICFCLYSFAKEFQSNRRGTFVGNCVVLSNYNAAGTAVYECLRELHTDTVNNPKNIKNNVLQVQHIRDIEVKEPLKFSTLAAGATPANGALALTDNKKAYFIAADKIPAAERDATISLFFQKAITEFLQIPVLYFSASPAIVDHVRAQGLLPVTDWNEFKNFTYQPVNHGKKKPAPRNVAPVKTESNPSKPVPERFQPSEFIFRPWNAPLYPWDIQELQKRIEEHNKIIQQYEKLENELQQLKSSIEEEGLSDRFAFFLNHNKLPIFISGLGSLCILLIYLSFHAPAAGEIAAKTPPPDTLATISPAVAVTAATIPAALHPLPNERLPENDVSLLTKEGIMGKTIEEVVQLLFQLNPTDIKQHYTGQERHYAQVLIDRNKDCFKPYNNLVICHCSVLPDIPIYK